MKFDNLGTQIAFELVKNSLNDWRTFVLWSFGGQRRYLDILVYSIKEHFDFVYAYPGVFLESDKKLEGKEYIPETGYDINTIDRNTLTLAFLGDIK